MVRRLLGNEGGEPPSNDDRDLKEVAEAMEAIAGHPPIPATIDPISAFMLLAQIQLAIRHPSNQGTAAETAKLFARGLQERLVEMYPPIAGYLEKGWYPIFDVDPEGEPARKAKFADLDRDRQIRILVNQESLIVMAQTLSDLSGVSFEAIGSKTEEQRKKAISKLDDIAIARLVAELDAEFEDGGDGANT
jgi:hypothetical protein